MDVSDVRLLQTIYYILASSISIRKRMSLYEFKSFMLAELRNRHIRIDLINEEHHLFAANNQVILYFPKKNEDERQILVILMEILIPYAETYIIAYAIQNTQGACVIRFELSDGFVSSHEKGN